MDAKDTKELFDKYVVPSYSRKPLVLVKGEGSRVWDSDGKRYLDLFPGWGCDGIGHCHPKLVEAIKKQAAKLIHVDNTFYNELQGKLAQVISTRSFGGKLFFCNSGAEANEGAIKFARIFTDSARNKVITTRNSFHGRTLATITATGQDKYHQGIGPLSPGFEYVFVANAIDDETCAVMLEPVQGEGGVNLADESYMVRLRELCDGMNVLLIFDEVQTGCGRLGEYFAHKLFGVKPDLMTLAKSLAGGVAMGAIEARPDIADKIVPGLHASTFGGNPLACAAAIATFEAIDEEGLLEHTKAMGKHLRDRLRALAAETGLIKDVRGRGLMVGAELTFPGTPVVIACMENGLLINCTHDTVIRFLPAMTVTEAELDEGLDIFAAALKQHGGNE